MGMPLHVPRFTIDVLDTFPEDGTRYELLEGVLLVTPAPSYAHQVVATRLATVLSNALRSREATVVGIGAIQRGNNTQLQPDILVCPGVYPARSNWRDMGGWWLAVEVMSPSSRLYDRDVKRAAYLALGVKEYWLVDIDDCSVEVWTASERAGRRVTAKLVWRPVASNPEIVIDLDSVFSGVCSSV